jgi:hypothetical protein
MKKIIFFLTLIIPKILFGQYNYMALTLGLSHPIGSYAANKDLSTNGFAYNGLTADYSGAYYLTGFFGIAGDIKYASNTMDNNRVRKLLESEIPFQFNGDTSVTYKLGYWKNVSFLVGPQITASTGKFSADIFALAGLSIIMNPAMDVTVIIGNQSYRRTTSPEYARFGFDVGAGLRYKLNDNYGIRVFASYFQSTAKGKIQDEISINTQQINIKTYSTQVQTLNIGIGIIYVLNNNPDDQINDDSSPY